MVDDVAELVSVWSKATELAVKFLDEDKAVLMVRNAARQLRELEQYPAAAQLYLSVDSIRDAIDSLIEGVDWTKALKISRELEPSYAPQVETAYRQWLTSQGKAEQLADVDFSAALELLAQQGRWDSCLENARRHGAQLLDK